MSGFTMKKIFSHDASEGLFFNKSEALEKNPENPDAKLFSIIGKLEDFRLDDGSFHLKICYPEMIENFKPPCNEWIQTSNPAKESSIKGYRAISLAFNKKSTGGDWGGLALNSLGVTTLIDESPNNANWWFAIGATKNHRRGGYIPGPGPTYSSPPVVNGAVKKVELYVENPARSPATGWCQNIIPLEG
jgi:hypothetical protein